MALKDSGRNPIIDTDRDGLTDDEELALGSSPTSADSDRDGLSDDQELRLGTDPLQFDTDRDGVSDGVEVRQNRDPLVNETQFNLTLHRLRQWASDAVECGRDRNDLTRIGVVAQQFLAGTLQKMLPDIQRDPNFQNPDFVLPLQDSQQMQADAIAAAEVRRSRQVSMSDRGR